MHCYRTYLAVIVMLGAVSLTSQAQDFKLFDRDIQVHGFVSQGYVYTSGNNWLTMTTNGNGSAGFTEMGLNMSTSLFDKFRIGAQVYDRNLGQLGQYHPALDWAMADFRFKPWLGFRGGRVKTTLGLYTDTQDLDFLRVFALMPQSVYPLDLRDANIAHNGGDVYGTIPLGRHRGALSYTVFSGHRDDSMYSGFPYFLQARGTIEKNYGGLQYGADLRWNTPLKGLLVGISRLNEDLHGFGLLNGNGNLEKTKNKADFTNQFYGEYTWGKLLIDAEYKRFYRDHRIRNLTAEDATDVHAWYIAGSYRLMKRLAVGTYYSHYTITSTFLNLTDTSLPSGHDYDKAVSGRVDINRFWNVKVEGHFMDGYGFGPYPNGFYPQQNPTFVPNTKALVLKTGVNF
jgi:hypothetical protein